LGLCLVRIHRTGGAVSETETPVAKLVAVLRDSRCIDGWFASPYNHDIAYGAWTVSAVLLFAAILEPSGRKE